MGALIVIVVVVVAIGATVLTALGFRQAPPLEVFRADRTLAVRHFADPIGQVEAAFHSGAQRTPGVRIADRRPGVLLLDCRPTARILSGDFGVVLRVRFAPEGPNGAAVHVDSQAKLWGPTRASTLRELERAVRMRAKAYPITELT